MGFLFNLVLLAVELLGMCVFAIAPKMQNSTDKSWHFLTTASNIYLKLTACEYKLSWKTPRARKYRKRGKMRSRESPMESVISWKWKKKMNGQLAEELRDCREMNCSFIEDAQGRAYEFQCKSKICRPRFIWQMAMTLIGLSFVIHLYSSIPPLPSRSPYQNVCPWRLDANWFHSCSRSLRKWHKSRIIVLTLTKSH